jgi:hypothetical protein
VECGTLQALEGGSGGGGSAGGRAGAPIGGIAGHRVSQGGEMDADLVRATGVDPHAQQCGTVETLLDAP